MSAVFADRIDLIRHEAMGLTVNGVGGLGIVGLDEAEDLAC